VLSISNTKKFYRVEHGISLEENSLNDKGKPETMKVQIIQGDFEDMTYVDTDELGNFWTSGFYFNDTLDLPSARPI